MDISEKYIKMCEKAEEIQNLGSVLIKTYWIDMIHIDTVGNFWALRLKKAVWLPRQDQLQKIIIADWKETFIGFMWWYQDEDTSDYKSMEQLWLAFVMKEKFNKIWNGSKWE